MMIAAKNSLRGYPCLSSSIEGVVIIQKPTITNESVINPGKMSSILTDFLLDRYQIVANQPIIQ